MLGVELHAPANGITPAQAGKRHSMHQRKASAKDHPRVGGEKIQSKKVWIADHGSPPRRRGKVIVNLILTKGHRITPAQAGKSRCSSAKGKAVQNHPRVGGEKNKELEGVWLPMESPPHGRGKVLTNGLVHGIDGITPARRGKVDVLFWGLVDGRITPAQAGKRGSGLLFHRVWWDHPRVGGEKLKHPKYTTDKGGSPPHGRGKEASIFDDGQRLGITPA